MEPKLTLYRIILAVGVVGFIFSLKVNYFPSGWFCIATALFTAFYLWQELMCGDRSRETDYIKPIEKYNEPNIINEFDPTFHVRRNPELFKFWLFLLLPFFVWHIMCFGIGYGAHKLFSTPIVKEYVVSYVYEAKGRDSFHGMKIKNIKTYGLFSVKIPKSELEKIKNKKDAPVQIDSYQSLFGLSFDKDFTFKSIKD